MNCDFLLQLNHRGDHRTVSVTQVTCVGTANGILGQRFWRFSGRDSRKRKKREALGRFTSASPCSAIKVSNTSLDHLLLGKAADWKSIRLYFAAAQIYARKFSTEASCHRRRYCFENKPCSDERNARVENWLLAGPESGPFDKFDLRASWSGHIGVVQSGAVGKRKRVRLG
jgi:hypothetical protein